MTSPRRHLHLLRWSVVACVLAGMLALPSLSGGATPPPPSSNGLKAYFDPADTTKSPLDLFGVRFGQTASTDLTLLIRTQRPWDSRIIDPNFHRSLCILLRSDEQANPAGRLCIYPSPTPTTSGLSLRYTVLDQKGVQLGIRDLTPVVTRPSSTTVRVSFPPSLLRLKPGLYHWSARSTYVDDGPCPGPVGCQDLLPNTGEADLNITLSVDPESRQRCFGAASRDVRVVCRNPKLSREVVPTPAQAVITPNLPCSLLPQTGLIIPCEFGLPPETATKSVALLGDSHAAHWRAGLEKVAQTFKWRGLSVTRSGCPLTKATPVLAPISRRNQCVRWNSEVPRWLASNPQISTVFVVAHFDARVIAKGAKSEFEAKVAGYTKAWKALPRTVKRIIVIRDTPSSDSNTLDCVSHAIAKHEHPGAACALPRGKALSQDPAVVAAIRLHSPRVKSIDLTSFFCNRKKCFPVVGGALVYKDATHLTDIYSSSLGPYLLRKIRGLSAGG